MRTASWKRHDVSFRSAILVPAAVVASIGLAPVAAHAQATESNEEPIGAASGGDAPAVTASPDYAFPDLPPRKPPKPADELPPIYIRPAISILLDYTAFDQDAANIAQMGPQEDAGQIRSLRLMLNGSIGGSYRVAFLVAGEYKGFASDPATTWNVTDVSLTFPMGDRTKLTVGKTKETFSYEMVGDAANLPQSERVLSPFFVSRNFGAKVTYVFGAAKTGTFSLGAFNEGWNIQSTGDPGWDFTARGTALVWDNPARNEFLHLGVAYRHAASNGTMRYRGRAETNVGDNAIDTGNFSASGGDHIGGEVLLNVGPYSLLGEYVFADVDITGPGNAQLSGWYLTGSWVITGETRPYDRNVGYARRVIPQGRWGATEAVARVSRVDLADGGIQGGAFTRLSLGLNWWATARWKFGISYGHTWLDRAGLDGNSDSLLTRIQWIY